MSVWQPSCVLDLVERWREEVEDLLGLKELEMPGGGLQKLNASRRACRACRAVVGASVSSAVASEAAAADGLLVSSMLDVLTNGHMEKE